MRKFFVATVASLMLALVGSFAPIAAQSGDYVLVRSFICETDPGATTLVGLGGELPEYCAEAGGVRITISDESGAFFSECTTNDRGACSLQAPLGETITITEDVSTVPTGYAPNRNPIVEETDPQGAAGEWIREFVNVATDDTVTLPNTGTGSANRAGGDRGLSSLAVTLLLGVTAVVFWRREMRAAS